jgi:Domain of unknown function (DUF1995)
METSRVDPSLPVRLWFLLLFIVIMEPSISIAHAFIQSSSVVNRNIRQSTRWIVRSMTDTNHTDEAQRLLERVKEMRLEIAQLTGQSVEYVELEAANKKLALQQRQDESIMKKENMKTSQSDTQLKRQYVIPVPETVDEQIQQAKGAIERAYRDGSIMKQIVRLSLVPCNTNDAFSKPTLLLNNEQDWPGGTQQIYREAARPYSIALLQQLRIRSGSYNSRTMEQQHWTTKPLIKEQILWDFDGSAIISTNTPTSNNLDTNDVITTETVVQALIQPNTDNRYFNDIVRMDQSVDNSTTSNALNLIINPFWKDASSWGFNILAPKAQQKAASTIFDEKNGYMETYNVLTKSVRGEDCVAIKAYPYDWQLHAYIENYDWPYTPYTIHLGSTTKEPSAADFVPLLNARSEFQYSKNMRQMQRTVNKNK